MNTAETIRNAHQLGALIARQVSPAHSAEIMQLIETQLGKRELLRSLYINLKNQPES